MKRDGPCNNLPLIVEGVYVIVGCRSVLLVGK